MGCSLRLLAAGASALTISTCLDASSAAAQTATPPPTQAVPTVVVTEGSRANPAYRLGEAIDSGTTVYDERTIQDRAPGSGDVLQILKQNPAVQFGLSEGRATRDTLRDLLPSDISISGGRPTENLFVLNGVGVNSMMETGDSNSSLDFDWVRGASPQSVWVDSDLVGQIIVRDSNVSAEFGRFTGGVVEITTREPSRRFGMQGGYSVSNDGLAQYHLSPSYTGANPPEPPRFDRRRWNLSADLPVNDTLGLLVSYSRSEATTYNNWSANLTDIGAEQFDQTNHAENYLAKLTWEPRDDLRLFAQVNHSPYTNVVVSASGINTRAENQGGGSTARFGASGSRGSGDWDLNLTYAFSDADKNAADWRFDVRGGTEPWCSAPSTGTCTNGYVGAIKQRQEDLSLNGSWSQPLWSGALRMGFAVTDVDAEKSRRDGGVYSYAGTAAVIAQAISPLTSCASATDVSCVEGRYAYNRKTVYPAYDAQVSLQTYGLWAEYETQWRGFDLRGGLRYDHESFLGDHTLSPRFSAARALPWWGIDATLGLNRYYGRSYLGFAIREKLTDTTQYSRTFTVVKGRRVWGDWVMSLVTPAQKYSGQGLDSPYTDEASLALSGKVWGGDWRLRGVYREGRDQFARSVAERITYVDALGVSRTVNRYDMTNDGESTYQGASLEYVKPWGRHTFSFSTNWSDTKTNSAGYQDIPDEDLAGETLVYFRGEVISLVDLYHENQRLDFAAPFMFNADWQSKWFDDRLSVTVGGRYRGAFEQIEQTSAFETVDGVRYRIYDVVDYKPSVDLDANASYSLTRGDHSATLEVRVSNLLDKIPNRNAGYSSQPWQLGRNAWVGLRVRY